MLTNLEVYSAFSSPPDIPLALGGSPEGDLIHIRNIEGLGPVKANINTTPYGSLDGEFYTGANIGSRNIVLTLGFNPDWSEETVSSLRQKIYGYFMPKLPVTLRLFSDELPAVEILGYTETCEPNVFSQDPEMQISVICPLPDFVAVSPSIVIGDAVTDADWEEFSLLSNVLTSILVELSRTSGTYDGLVTIEHKTLAPVTHKFEFGGSVAVGIDLQINTGRGIKAAENVVVATGEKINLLNSMSADSEWIALEPGVNKLRVLTESATPMPFKLTYHERFGGL